MRGNGRSTLITSKRGKSAAELAEEIECHPRTLYRDLEALQVAGFPIYTERAEGKNLWSLLDTLKHHNIISLDDQRDAANRRTSKIVSYR